MIHTAEVVLVHHSDAHGGLGGVSSEADPANPHGSRVADPHFFLRIHSLNPDLRVPERSEGF